MSDGYVRYRDISHKEETRIKHEIDAWFDEALERVLNHHDQTVRMPRKLEATGSRRYAWDKIDQDNAAVVVRHAHPDHARPVRTNGHRVIGYGGQCWPLVVPV